MAKLESFPGKNSRPLGGILLWIVGTESKGVVSYKWVEAKPSE
jgi:hypothetical protein